jgi:hypothetical protein
MATVTQISRKTPEELAEEYRYSAPLKYLGCRGFGHSWPKPGDRRNKRNFIMTTGAGGWSLLEMRCRDCGMTRSVTAEPGEVIQLPARRYSYTRPPGYALPKGAGKFFTRNDAANEAMRRYYEEQQHQTGGEEVPEKLTGHAS